MADLIKDFSMRCLYSCLLYTSSGKIIEKGDTLEVFSNPQQEMTKRFVETVISNVIPTTLLKELDYRYPVLKLTFFGESTKHDVISKINKHFKITTTILFASVNEVGEEILGILTIQLKGEQDEVIRAINYIQKQDVKIERVELNYD